MMSFMEFLAQSRKMAMPDARTMLAKAGIDLHGPHEIEVMRLVKAMKKCTSSGPNRTSAEGASCLRP